MLTGLGRTQGASLSPQGASPSPQGMSPSPRSMSPSPDSDSAIKSESGLPPTLIILLGWR